jgi:hypothetical protein
MKKAIVLAIIGLAAGAASSYGQGAIWLDNYDSTAHPLITYGAGSGGTLGAGIADGFTVGMYVADGSITALPDPTGTADPTTLSGSFALASGNGSTAPSATSAFGTAGQYASGFSFNPGDGAGVVVTVMLVAFNGASYDASSVRGHSQSFDMTTSVGTAFPTYTGDTETDGGFSVLTTVPEPTTLALGGLGALSLLAFRRRKV